ncbi:hypothetical protein HaLaN_29736 [Haematococcus lacustris]|uniref:Uncharacterized protein n=1 Tax=Haematococcus lacustris TaxID=44745 RepID=A0A6A0AFI1_HAELA|nr:hypothetical protein HaLaN_29736 [Haematococcus lacustris]
MNRAVSCTSPDHLSQLRSAWDTLPPTKFGLLSYITPFLIYNSILQLDPEEFGGHAELLNEGQMPALGAFFSSWIH